MSRLGAIGRASFQLRRALKRPRADNRLAVPSLCRVSIVVLVWIGTAFIGGACFHALESGNELTMANAIVEGAIAEGVLYRWPDGTISEDQPPHSSSYSYSYDGVTAASQSDGSEQFGRRLWGSEHLLDEAEPASNATNSSTGSNDTHPSYQGISTLFLSRQAQGPDACKQGPPDITHLQWTMPGSTFFAFTIMTTVGYGTFAPRTDGGRAFACIFGVVGIIVTGFVLGVLTGVIDAMLERLHKRLVSRATYVSRRYAVRIKGLAATLLVVAYMSAVALVAAWREGLPFGVAAYFVFITISTVGLGDYSLKADTMGDVLLQFVLFLPGLALFAEYINLGNELSKQADQAAVQVSGDLAKQLRVAPPRPGEEKEEDVEDEHEQKVAAPPSPGECDEQRKEKKKTTRAATPSEESESSWA